MLKDDAREKAIKAAIKLHKPYKLVTPQQSGNEWWAVIYVGRSDKREMVEDGCTQKESRQLLQLLSRAWILGRRDAMMGDDQ